ncbi:hypothetical protein ABT095_13210 [Kitasatospora sp. NPDC002227]|uniref:hypothetical protein n=1 Tax=Kitasatospora sp. NPDC002227 TaxID=3154773 RepID=UPI00331ACCEA
MLGLIAMEIVLIRLNPGRGPDPGHRAAADAVLPAVVADIVWANAVPDDELEHIRARPGPRPGSIDLALFHRHAGPRPPETSLRVARRAITASPLLAGWAAEPCTQASPVTLED